MAIKARNAALGVGDDNDQVHALLLQAAGLA